MRRARREDGEEQVELAYEIRTDAGADAAWLVLIHGLGYGRWGWEPVLDGLAARYRVLWFDNRGIGDSTVPTPPYTTPGMAEDVVAVLDDAGIGRAHVVGTSLGGMVAQELALRRPDRVDRLVLVCTTPGGELAYPLPEATQKLIAEMPSLEPAVALERAVRNALADRAPEDLVQRILEHRMVAPPDPAGWQGQAAAGATHDAGARLGGIAATTLVVHGTADVVVDPRNAGVLGERIPDARVVEFDGAGHLLFWEQPDHFVRVVTDFLAG